MSNVRFSRRVRPRTIGPYTVLAITLAAGAAVVGVMALVGILLWAQRRGRPTAVALAAATASEAAATAAPPEITPSRTPTPASLGHILLTIEAMTATANALYPSNTPTPILRPTGYYVAPIDPTPIPTPVLPEAAPFPESCDGPGRMNILFIGVDGRSSNYSRSARADALTVVGVNFGDRSAQMLSIPRDMWVQLPAHGNQPTVEGRINTAYALGQQYRYPGGGPAFQAHTISQTFGLRIDRTVVLNFATFENAVDTIGGIDIEVSRAIHDEKYPDDEGGTLVLDIPAGLIHMDGRTALMYARTRHQDSDFGRMRRQQQVMMAVRNQLLRPETLLVLPGLAQLIYQSVRTDLSLEEVALLGCAGPQIPGEAISRVVIDTTMVESFTAAGGAHVLRPKMDVILPLLEAFSTGQ